MSSKGAQETTNDGSDAKHREKIAAHYKGNKLKTKWSFSIVELVVKMNQYLEIL